MKNLLLSAAIGDISGVPYEFAGRTKDYDAVDLYNPKNTYSDDTVCTFACAEALLHNMDMAVLSILDSLKKEDITRILNNYYKSIQMSRLDREDVRFSLKDINKDVFKNISSVLKSFSKKDIYFP